ncbi:phage tail protein [Sporomusa sp.]|uniref:phage tail protein n=1 Tax=Sporomusa sp. TaxID=2078658 RepID=UPI002BC78CDA|nr:phage tail protein [Sporomusa sp.]HWR07755.1 phage tail protein [Sporomusa sp.]
MRGIVVVNDEQIELAKLMLGHIPGAVPKALSNAINRSVEGAQTEATRKAPEEYHVRSRDILASCFIKRSSPRRLIAYLKASGTARPLSIFKVSPSMPVSYWDRPNILKAATRKGEGLKGISKAFVEFGRKTGNMHVLQRTGDRDANGKEEVRILYGPSLPQMLGNDRVQRDITQRAMITMDTRLDHEMNRLLARYGK